MNLVVKLAIVVGFYSVLYAVYFAYIHRPYSASVACASKARLAGKTAILTEANTGIGKETALDLVRRGARVILACRDLTKAEVALKEIVEKTGSKNIVAKRLDLASLKSVREFAEDINNNEPRLDVLLNNAGVMDIQTALTKTQDSFESLMVEVSHSLGHFLLTNLLLDLLKRSAPARIINVSSLGHWLPTRTGLNFDNMNDEISYEAFYPYGKSATVNMLFTRELAKRLEGTRVTANSLHPGGAETEFVRIFPNWMQVLLIPVFQHFADKTPEQGVQTNIYLAVSEELEEVSGKYFVDCTGRTPLETVQDDEDAKELWKISSELVGLDISD